MAKFVLLEASPWRVSDGVAEAVHLAGGGSKPYNGLRSFTDWRSGLVDFPSFVAAAGFGQQGWTGGALPQTSSVRFFPSDDALRNSLATSYLWIGAAIEVRSGDDVSAPGTFILELTGTVQAVTIEDGALVFTIADNSVKLSVPVAPGTFAGTGGIEGPVEAEGKTKRRTFGFARNVEGFLLDKPNNIFEFGDPAKPLNSFVAVKDMGRDASPAPTSVTWQGSIAATFAALQASTPAAGSCVVAPSIACVKWWTVPAGPLTADIQGDATGGYVNQIADIAARLLSSSALSGGDGPELLGGAPTLGGSVSYTGGVATCTSATDIVRWNGVLTTGVTYHLVINYNMTSGSKLRVANGPTSNTNVAFVSAVLSGSGTIDTTFTALNSNVSLEADTGVYSGTVSISVKQSNAGGGISSADVATINGVRTGIAGLHIGDDNETFAQALDRLLIPANVQWALKPDGTIRLGEIQMSTSSETLDAISVDRIESYKPAFQFSIGYKRNHRIHNAGEISAAILTSDLPDLSAPVGVLVPNYTAVGDANRVRFSKLEKETLGWLFALTGTPTITQTMTAFHNDGDYLWATGSFNAATQQVIFVNNSPPSGGLSAYKIPVTAGERVFARALIQVSSLPAAGRWYLFYGFWDEANASKGSGVVGTVRTTVTAGWELNGGFVTVPSGATHMTIHAFCDNLGSGTATGSFSLAMKEPLVTSAGSAQVAFPAFSPGPTGEPGAEVTRKIDGPPQSLTFKYDYLGAKDGWTSRDLTFKVLDSAGQVVTNVTMTAKVTQGGYNGLTTASSPVSLSMASGTGTLTVNSVDSSTGSIQISAVANGVAVPPLTFNFAKDIGNPPISSGGGGGGSVTIDSDTTGFPTINSTGFTTVSTLSGVLPAGKSSIQLSAQLIMTPTSAGGAYAPGANNVELKILRDNGGGSFTQIGTTQQGSTYYTPPIAGDPADMGQFEFNYSPPADTGLTAGNTYTYLFQLRLTTGTRLHGVSGDPGTSMVAP